MRLPLIVLLLVVGLCNVALAADYKPEFRMSVVANEDTAWGRAANRFANAVKFRTQGRINIKNYFEGRLFTGEQTTEFDLMQQGKADFAIGSTVNWSPQVKELNYFCSRSCFQITLLSMLWRRVRQASASSSL